MSNADSIVVTGITLVRNASLLEYPFRESVLSLLPLCDELILNCGDSTDDTAQICDELAAKSQGRIKVLHTVWEKENQSGGFQLKHQTDIALARARGRWCVYLQADEVMHEADSANIRGSMKLADELPEVDGLLFDYIHFYGNYSFSIRGRNWYRREVRAFKTNRGIESFRDAQGFRKSGKKLLVIPSGGRVFHYGYVRSSSSLKRKSNEMAQWWGQKPVQEESGFQLHRHVGLEKFTGTHPAVMASRLAENAQYTNPAKCSRKWDKNEIKNAVTLLWESIFPYRIGEFKNYELKK